MGEEKPDEELMGKRKSSPRLSPALLAPVLPLWPNPRELYLPAAKFRDNCDLPIDGQNFQQAQRAPPIKRINV